MGDLKSKQMTETCVNQCSYGIKNNFTMTAVDELKFRFKISEVSFCGANFPVYFVFCGVGGGVNNTAKCSNVYEIGGQMPDEGVEYAFLVNLENEPFESIS